MNTGYQKIHIALPVVDESEQLPAFLDMLMKQTFRDFTLHVCVNQPEEWWDHPSKSRICLDNQKTLELLGDWKGFPLKVIDRSSKGKGWKRKKHGVGWARKTVMDSISEMASQNDLVVSMDADTLARICYLESVLENFHRHPGAIALAVPYYHLLTGDPEADRAILRYEIYMRNYNINLFRIHSPYSFTALGSAMAFPVWAYRKIGGMTPVLSGEDFYFLQKLLKSGPVLFWNREKVYPAARFSDRVYFGTGPAMEKGRSGDWESYPVYHHSLFERVEKTYRLFPDLFYKSLPTPMDDFMNEIFKEEDIWEALRKNYKLPEKFVRACHTKIDGLRILQYLKKEQKNILLTDEECLKENLKLLDPGFPEDNPENWGDLDFAASPIRILDLVRNRLVKLEEELQKDCTEFFNRR